MTTEEKQELKTAVLNEIKAESQSVDELEQVTTLDGVVSLPAMRGTDVVAAPVSLLSKPAQDAAVTANAAAARANNSANAADSAAQGAEQSAGRADDSATNADTAAANANAAASSANAAANSLRQYDKRLAEAHKGATARFSMFVESGTVQAVSSVASGGEVVYVRSAKVFAYRVEGSMFNPATGETRGTGRFDLYNNWAADGVPSADLFLNESRSGVLKDKLFLTGDEAYVWSDEESDLVQVSGKGGSGSGLYNVTMLHPLTTGYYTKETAIAALADADIDDTEKRGMIITFEKEAGVWADYRFIGTTLTTFLTPGAWEQYGTKDVVKSVSVNGVRKQPDAEGNVSLDIERVEVDASLDPASTNPVQNAAVSAKLSELEAGTLFGSEVVENDDSTVTVQLKSKSAVITEFTVPAGGGGGGETAGTKIVLTASVDATTIKEGGQARLTWSYDHQFTGGDDAGQSTGQKAAVEIMVRRGTTVTYQETKNEVSRGTYTLDLSKYLLLGTSDIYVTATATDPTTGKPQRKPAYVSVKVVTLSLSSSYNIGNALQQGGYAATESAEIPFAVSGSGAKTVMLYLDGAQKETQTVTRSGTTNGVFSIGMQSLAVGRHTVQMVAEMEQDGLSLRSESIYMDILKKGSSTPWVGIKAVHPGGRILTGDAHSTPRLVAGQYQKLEFEFAAYDPAVVPATVQIWLDGSLSRSVSVGRTAQAYSNRFTSNGRHNLKLRIGATVYTAAIDVEESGVDIAEATYGLLFKLDAAGRSNDESETDRARWEDGGVSCAFEGVDWKSSGWKEGALKLSNGARAVIGYRPFATDVKGTGLTIELTMRVSNVMDRAATVVGCVDGGKGLLITAQEASFRTGQTVDYTNEDGDAVSREVKLATNYAAGDWMKVALTIGTASQDRLMQLYVNGNRTGADIYDSAFNFKQDTPQAVTIDSAEADVEIKSVRVYSRALTDDEELENRMVDCDGTDEMMEVYAVNDILGDTGDVDMDKLRAKGKGVMRIVRQNKLDDVYAENNKKTDFLADIYFYSALGADFDFVLTNCYIRIQGTSSTKYPSKNLRIYLSKGTEQLSLTGQRVTGGKKWQMRPGALPVSLLCAKSDYSDSSMSLNTGGAKLFNDVMKELGLLTPPQRHQYEQGGGSLSSVTVRTAIDGQPIDIFCAETLDGESVYYGQYNLNNEKSKSGPLFGMEGVDGFTASCPLALEMLNNTSPVCLFQSTGETNLIAEFDGGAEVNYGVDSNGAVQGDGDVKWAGLASAQQVAVRRLYAWIRSCIPSGANASDLSTFVSAKFKSEVAQYFDVDFVLTYYIFTDYFLSVDQRAKNMMLRTWDGLKWYITYYDGDTQMGKRNDCFLVYTYTTDRATWDAEASKYAFEGHDSWLWNLVLANLGDELKRCAAAFRAVMTNARVLGMLNGEQAGNWSDRAYNKSGYLKYIAPATHEMFGKVWPFIYALQGSNTPHREFFVKNRFALLDAKYGTSNFTSDNIDLYMARASGDTADTLRITANETYAFGYGTNNSPDIANTGIVDGGTVASLAITGAYTVNDPLRVYGASRMRRLDMTGAASHLKNALDLGKCAVLRELDLTASGSGSTGWWLSIGSCRQLRVLRLRNQAQAKTGGSTSTELDLTNQTKLEELDARGTRVQSVNFAKGAPVALAKLPSTLTTLRLEYLARLPMSGLTMEGWGNVRTLIFDNCSLLDWETLLSRCTGADRLRVTGIDREDDGTWLNRFMSMGGVDADGNSTDTCALVGSVRLTKYMEPEQYAVMAAHFPELNIYQPEYTVIEMDTTVADDANVSNPDNATGYRFGNDYAPSGHVAAILAKRHRVLAKMTRKPTTRSVSMAGNTVSVNNKDGQMTYYPLHDADSERYADASDVKNCAAAKLDGTEGDLMMYEPGFWCKGVNDYLGGKNYSCYSSNDTAHKPKSPEVDVLTMQDIKDAGGYMNGRKIVAKETLATSYTNDSAYSVCQVDVSSHSRVRFPSVPGTGLVGAVFCDASGNVVENVIVPTLSSKFEAGMYLVKDVPSGAKTLNFSVLNTAEFDKVVLSNSTKMEDMEPDWYWDEEHLCGVVETVTVGEKFRSCITGGASTGNMTWVDFHYYSVQRGMQQIDAMMHSRIANLCYAKYGRRGMQETCGAGQHSNARNIGNDVTKYGMVDTIGFDYAKAVTPDLASTLLSDTPMYQFAWFKTKDAYGAETVERVNNTVCLGYVNAYGDKYEMMDGVDLPNDSGNAYKWRIWMPDGSIRMVKGSSTSSLWITGVVHGLYMDMVPAGNFSGSSSTYYTDMYYISGSTGRVVYRGYNGANADGGVSFAYAYNDASYSNSNVGSRLAFRGQIVRAQSVGAFKALTEVA